MKSAIPSVLLMLSSQFVSAEEVKSATLHIDRIQCIACAATVKKALSAVPGVKTVSVDVERKQVVVQFDPGKTSGPELADATKKRGFPADIRKVGP